MIYCKQHKLVSELRENLFMSIQSLPNWFSQVLQLVLNLRVSSPSFFLFFYEEYVKHLNYISHTIIEKHNEPSHCGSLCVK